MSNRTRGAVLFAAIVLWFSAVITYAIWVEKPSSPMNDWYFYSAIVCYVVGFFAFILAIFGGRN